MSSHKSMPLTKDETMQLVNLVATNPVLYSKATNASNNQLKDATWATITDTFNSMIKSCPRRPEQLRLKWENLKKAARKRSTRIRMNNFKTGGGKAEFIAPDDILDKVASILGPTCDGYTVQFGGDAEVGEVERLEVVEEYDIEMPVREKTPPVVAEPALSLHASTPKFFFSSVSKGKLRSQTIADEVKRSVRDRNRAIANYYDSKRKWEEELKLLKKRKLELCIRQQDFFLKMNLKKNLVNILLFLTITLDFICASHFVS